MTRFTSAIVTSGRESNIWSLRLIRVSTSRNKVPTGAEQFGDAFLTLDNPSESPWVGTRLLAVLRAMFGDPDAEVTHGDANSSARG